MSASFLPGAPHPQVASTDGKHLVPSQLSPSDSNYKLWHNTTADHGASDKCNMLLPVHFNQALPVKHAELFGWETGQQWQPFTSISATWSITADQCDNRGLIMKGVAKWKLLIKRFPQTVQPLWPFLKKKVKRETVKAENWTGLNTSADSLRVDCRNPDSPNLSNRFPQVASAGCSNADSHATGSGKQRPSVALVAIVKFHLCVLLNNPCTSKVRAKCDLCCHHKNKNKKKKNNRRSLHPSRTSVGKTYPFFQVFLGCLKFRYQLKVEPQLHWCCVLGCTHWPPGCSKTQGCPSGDSPAYVTTEGITDGRTEFTQPAPSLISPQCRALKKS